MSVRVVVAEDEALIRLDLVETLGELGYEVVGQATTGQAAVELVRRERPDVVLMDIRMPVLDGLSAAEEIQAEGTTAVVLLTAFSERSLIERASEAGVTSYLVKPVSPAQVMPAIELALSTFKQRDALNSQVSTLGTQLAARKNIDRAKGRLIDALGLNEDQAYRWLQRTAMNERTSVADVAERVVAGQLP